MHWDSDIKAWRSQWSQQAVEEGQLSDQAETGTGQEEIGKNHSPLYNP